MLCVVCLARDKVGEAQEALACGLRLGLGCAETFPCQAFILQQAGDGLHRLGLYGPAESAYRRALQSSAAPAVAMALARTLEARGDVPGAVEALRGVAEAAEAAAESRAAALDRLVELCDRTRRAHDAAAFREMRAALPK